VYDKNEVELGCLPHVRRGDGCLIW